MLFLTLLLYEPLWLLLFVGLGLHSFVRDAGLPAPAVPAAVFALAYGVTWLVAYSVHSYQPEWKPFFVRVIRREGVRWMALATAYGSLIAFAMVAAANNLPMAGALGPIALVSLVNGLRRQPIPRLLLPDVPTAPGLVPPDTTMPEMADSIVRVIRWTVEGQALDVRVVIRRALWEELRSRPRILDIDRWTEEYVVGGVTAEVRDIARKLVQMGRQWSTWNEAELVLAFTQNAVTYQFDDEGHPGHPEWPKYPVESLGDGTGDCEDSTFIGAVLLAVMGYDCAMLIVPGHAALGVAGCGEVPGGSYYDYEGKRYYYCESTADGFKIGQMPSEFQGVKAEVHPIPAARLLPEE